MAARDAAVRLHPRAELVPETAKVSRPFLKIICTEKITGGIQEFEGYPVCTAPPPFVGESALPGQFGIGKVYLGHFTSPTADEAVLGTSGGEPHASHFGGTALLERKDGTWGPKWYRSGLMVKDCATLRRSDGSELLLCFFSDTEMGVTVQELYTVDLTKPRESERETVLRLTDDTVTCGGYLNLRDGAHVQRGRFKEIALSNGGSLLTATVEFGARTYTPDERGGCAIGVTNGLKVPSALLPKMELYELKFDWDGARLKVQPESAKTAVAIPLW